MRPARDALLFDLDGTLVDSAPAITQALTIQRRRRGMPPINVRAVKRWVGYGAETLVSRALAPNSRELSADLAEFRIILNALPAHSQRLYPGVAAALHAFAETGFRMAVVTNKPESLSRRLLAALGIDASFTAIVGGDTMAYAKPHPAPLLHALHMLGASATESLFIGDSEIDAAAAASLGIPFIYFAAGYGGCDAECPPVTRFDFFSALPDLVRGMT